MSVEQPEFKVPAKQQPKSKHKAKSSDSEDDFDDDEDDDADSNQSDQRSGDQPEKRSNETLILNLGRRKTRGGASTDSRQRRLEKNRESARESRKRKKNYI